MHEGGLSLGVCSVWKSKPNTKNTTERRGGGGGGFSSISWFICCRAARALARTTRRGKEEYITSLSLGPLAYSNSSINRLLLEGFNANNQYEIKDRVGRGI